MKPNRWKDFMTALGKSYETELNAYRKWVDNVMPVIAKIMVIVVILIVILCTILVFFYGVQIA